MGVKCEMSNVKCLVLLSFNPTYENIGVAESMYERERDGDWGTGRLGDWGKDGFDKSSIIP